jgi:hypothetical protein
VHVQQHDLGQGRSYLRYRRGDVGRFANNLDCAG